MASMVGLARRDRRWALLAAAAEAWFALNVILLDILDPSLSVLDDAVSDLVHGPLGFLLVLALLVHGVGVLALAWALRSLPHGTGWRLVAGLVALAGAGLCILLVGVFPTDLPGDPRTTAGAVHAATATLSFLFLPVAFLLLAGPLRSVPALRAWVLPVAILSAVATIALGVSLELRHLGGFGAVERIAIFTNTAWLLGVAAVTARAPRQL